MIPYFILLTVPILLNPFVKDTTINHVKMNKLPLFLFFAFFTVMVMARHHNVGSDTNKYIYIFQRVAQTSWNRLTEHSLEPGFQLFSKLISLLSKDPQVFLAAAGLMVSALLYPTFRRLCIDAPLTIVLFCVMSIFPMMLSGIRQMMAIGFGMIAYAFVRRRKPILFLHSREDPYSTPDQAEKLFEKCKSPNKRLVWFEKGRHSRVRVNAPEKYDNTIIEFLKDLNK